MSCVAAVSRSVAITTSSVVEMLLWKGNQPIPKQIESTAKASQMRQVPCSVNVPLIDGSFIEKQWLVIFMKGKQLKEIGGHPSAAGFESESCGKDAEHESPFTTSTLSTVRTAPAVHTRTHVSFPAPRVFIYIVVLVSTKGLLIIPS